jgi:carbon monoxide dehydrogenase subunit G
MEEANMKDLARIWASVFFIILLASALPGAEDWTQQTFQAPADEVYAAAKKVIRQHHEIKSTDDTARTVRFHVGMTAWSWGYNVDLNVEPTGERTSVARATVARSGGKTFSWGSGQKEVKKIWRWMTDELNQNAQGQGGEKPK